MIKQVLLLLCLGGSLACASDYYVDCNYGSNGNPGTSPQQAWRTLLQVGISTFLPGDTINLRRDCTWNETLTPPSSGSSGSLIKIDSYGNGQPPHLTDLDVVKYTGPGDPFRIDFGYRAGSAVKMFHGVSVAVNADQALALVYRYSRVEAGMRQEQLQPSLTAVVDQGMALREDKTRFAIGMLEQNSVRVRTVEEMAEIAGEVRRELRA